MRAGLSICAYGCGLPYMVRAWDTEGRGIRFRVRRGVEGVCVKTWEGVGKRHVVAQLVCHGCPPAGRLNESLHAIPLLVDGDGGSSSVHMCRPTPC